MTAIDAGIGRRERWFWLLACLSVLLRQAVGEHLMGRVAICTCGYVKLFENAVNSSA